MVGWRPALAVSESQAPRSSLWRLVVAPVQDREDVALPNGHALASFRFLEVLGEHVLAGFEPRNLPEAGHVSGLPRAQSGRP